MSKAALARTLAALDQRGLVAASITIKPGGEVEIIPAAKPADGLTPPARLGVVDDLDSWREKQRGRRAP